MSAIKAYLMSPAHVAACEAQVARAQARFDAVCAAAALAAHRVDAATLDDITYYAARDLGEAYEELAVSRGYAHAHDMMGCY